MASLKILTMIISLCQITSVEDNKSSWTELQKVERYQRDCRVWYIDCYEKNFLTINISEKNIAKCMRERLK